LGQQNFPKSLSNRFDGSEYGIVELDISVVGFKTLPWWFKPVLLPKIVMIVLLFLFYNLTKNKESVRGMPLYL
jgi:hypothetical protein